MGQFSIQCQWIHQMLACFGVEVHVIGVQGCGFLRRLQMLTTMYVAQVFINCCFICNKELCYNLKDVYTCP
jgi:hypothetical protein